MIEEFKKLLFHPWTNFRQAQNSPSHFSHVHYQFWEEPEGEIHSAQWYDWSGEMYRERDHKLLDKGNHLELQTFRKDGTKEPSMIFQKSEDGFTGRTEEGAKNSKGDDCYSYVTITADKFTSIDEGRTWGKTPGPFIFERKYID